MTNEDVIASAAARWKAVEAFAFGRASTLKSTKKIKRQDGSIEGGEPKSMPLSALARRLGIALVISADTETFACFPGEERLAALCDSDVSAIRRAKAELRAAGLVTWSSHEGPWKTAVYRFDWRRIDELAAEAKARAKAVSDAAKQRRATLSESRR